MIYCLLSLNRFHGVLAELRSEIEKKSVIENLRMENINQREQIAQLQQSLQAKNTLVRGKKRIRILSTKNNVFSSVSNHSTADIHNLSLISGKTKIKVM